MTNPPASSEGKPSTGKKMVYETSAGGVVLRHIRGSWQVAIIEPNIINADTVSRRTKARPEGTVFALPKGAVDAGETPEQSADREVFEETGVRGRLLFRLTTIRYLYQRTWGGREHVSKAVSFYLFLYHSGRLGQICTEMRDEVRKAFWFPLDKAHRKLTYRGEREVLKMAQKIVREQPELLTPPPLAEVTTGPQVPRPVAQQRSASQRFLWPARNTPPQNAGRGRDGNPRGSAPNASQRNAPSRNSGASRGRTSQGGASQHAQRPNAGQRGPGPSHSAAHGNKSVGEKKLGTGPGSANAGSADAGSSAETQRSAPPSSAQ